MKSPLSCCTVIVALSILLFVSSLSLGGDTEPNSMAWQRKLGIIYVDPGMESHVRQSAKGILEATLPRLSGRKPNVLSIEEGSCTPTVIELVRQFKAFEAADAESAIDARVVFVFTRVDGYSILLAADAFGQFEWVNIKHALPTLEQRRALWRALPYEVVSEYPGPLKRR